MSASSEIPEFLREVSDLLRRRGKTISVAESCTGGLICKLLTDVPGSSNYFLEGIIAYSNWAKVRLLGVPELLIEQHGAVSDEVCQAMASGCRSRSGADLAVATTGIAGPDGGTPEKPVGLVYVGLADDSGCRVTKLQLDPSLSRRHIREQTAQSVLDLLRGHLISP